METRAALEYQLNWISSALPVLGDDQIFFSVALHLLKKKIYLRRSDHYSRILNVATQETTENVRAITDARDTRKIAPRRKLEASSGEYLAEIYLEIFSCAEPNGADNFCKFLARHA